MSDDGLRVVVGLGNPGPRYAGTRHNIGFDVIDALSADGAEWCSASHSRCAECRQGDRPLLLVKPTTYMNESGAAVQEILQRCPVALQDILVLVDDIHLDPGRIRLRRRGSDGGHNGLKSIIATVGSTDFPRMRLGVGAPPEGQDLITFVLDRFDDPDVASRLARTGADAALSWATDGVELTMNRFNGT